MVHPDHQVPRAPLEPPDHEEKPASMEAVLTVHQVLRETLAAMAPLAHLASEDPLDFLDQLDFRAPASTALFPGLLLATRESMYNAKSAQSVLCLGMFAHENLSNNNILPMPAFD